MNGASTPGTRSEGVGILAGNGVYPRLLATQLRRRGRRVVCAGIHGQTEDGVSAAVDAFRAFPLGAVKRIAAYFLERDVRRIFFAGGVSRPVSWRTLRPDAVALRLLLTSFTAGDDRLLRRVAHGFETFGLTVDNPLPYLDDLFVDEGRVSGPELDPQALSDMRLAWRAARDLGRRDRGQASVAHVGRVVGLESRGGTDVLIQRVRRPGAVMVKVVKPTQDERFDLPAIGPSTLECAHVAGLRAIGIQAGGVLVLERDRTIAASNRYGITLMSYSSKGPPATRRILSGGDER